SAPPRWASTAAQTGSGSYVWRACRTVATWSMLTPSSIIASDSCRELGLRLGYSQPLQIDQDLPRFQRHALQLRPEHLPRQALGRSQRPRCIIPPARDIPQHAPGEGFFVGGIGQDQLATEHAVVRARLQRTAL